MVKLTTKLPPSLPPARSSTLSSFYLEIVNISSPVTVLALLRLNPRCAHMFFK